MDRRIAPQARDGPGERRRGAGKSSVEAFEFLAEPSKHAVLRLPGGTLGHSEIFGDVGRALFLDRRPKIIVVPAVPAGTERGCRTEIVAEVDDAEKLLANLGGGALGPCAKDYYASLHRVAYYGDHTRTIRHLAHLMGLKVVEEG